MKALNYLKSLLPNFSKQTVLEDIRSTRMTLVTATIPAYQSAMPMFASRKMANQGLQAHWETFKRNVKGAGGGPNVIVVVDKSFKNMLATLDVIERLVEKASGVAVSANVSRPLFR